MTIYEQIKNLDIEHMILFVCQMSRNCGCDECEYDDEQDHCLSIASEYWIWLNSTHDLMKNRQTENYEKEQMIERLCSNCSKNRSMNCVVVQGSNRPESRSCFK